MTNEELAIAIQNGETELYPVLWEQVSRWVEIRAKRYALYLQECGIRNDAEDFWKDLYQSAWFAVVEAVRRFDISAGYKFLTYLERPMRKAFQSAAGIRTSKRDPIDFAVPLDAPCGEDGDTSILDLVADDADDMAGAEESVYLWELRAVLESALATLSEREQQILKDRYFYGMDYADQAEQHAVSKAYISQTANQALDKLRSNHRVMEELAEFMPDYEFDPYKFTGLAVWKHTNLSVQDRTVLDLLL